MVHTLGQKYDPVHTCGKKYVCHKYVPVYGGIYHALAWNVLVHTSMYQYQYVLTGHNSRWVFHNDLSGNASAPPIVVSRFEIMRIMV